MFLALLQRITLQPILLKNIVDLVKRALNSLQIVTNVDSDQSTPDLKHIGLILGLRMGQARSRTCLILDHKQ